MDNTASETVLQTAHAPKPLQPREMTQERLGAGDTVAYSRKFPTIRGGQCERCGTVDANQPGEYQYKLCEHYRGKDMKCSYCPREKNQDEMMRYSILRVQEHPDKPGVLVSWCNSTECQDKHIKRFNVSL